MAYCLGFFIPEDTVIGYQVRKEHEPYLGDIIFSDRDYSPQKMHNVIQTLYKNCNQNLKPFELTIKNILQDIKEDLEKYKKQPQELLKKHDPILVNQFSKIKNINFGHKYIQGKIAILINENTGSAAEMVAKFLKNHMGEKIQIIGTPSAGAVLTSHSMHLIDINSGKYLEFDYPIGEVIATDFVRMEGNPIQPDIFLTDPVEILKAAEEWIK